MPAFREDLKTEVLGLSYDVTRRMGLLSLPPGCCADMDGAIALFTAIDPEARRIETMAGPVLDTVYVRICEGVWKALAPPDLPR